MAAGCRQGSRCAAGRPGWGPRGSPWRRPLAARWGGGRGARSSPCPAPARQAAAAAAAAARPSTLPALGSPGTLRGRRPLLVVSLLVPSFPPSRLAPGRWAPPARPAEKSGRPPALAAAAPHGDPRVPQRLGAGQSRHAVSTGRGREWGRGWGTPGRGKLSGGRCRGAAGP